MKLAINVEINSLIIRLFVLIASEESSNSMNVFKMILTL